MHTCTIIPNKKYVCSIVLGLHEGWDGQLDGRMRRSSAQPLGLACRGGWMGWTAGWKDEIDDLQHSHWDWPAGVDGWGGQLNGRMR